MMKSSADADADSIDETLPRRQNRSPGRQPECIYQLARVRNLHLHFLARGERGSSQFLHILRFVHEQNVLVGRRLRLQEIISRSNTSRNQTIANAPILLRRKHMIPDRKKVSVAVDKLERKHDR